jgi:hypothetical protein
VSSILWWPDDVVDIGSEAEGGDEGGAEGGDEGGGDGFFTTVAYLRISFDNDDFIIGFVSILEFVSMTAYNS